MRVYASLYGCARSLQGGSDSFNGKSQFVWYHLRLILDLYIRFTACASLDGTDRVRMTPSL